MPIWPWSKRQIEAVCSHLCRYALREPLPASASLLGARVTEEQDLRFLFHGKAHDSETVSIHVLNESKGNSVFLRKMKKSISKNSINHSEAYTLEKLEKFSI